MITQIFKQGKNEIKIEMPENLADAKKHGFSEGQPNKCYINGKLITNYQAMIRFMVDESKKQNEKFTVDKDNMAKQRKQLFDNQRKALKEEMDAVRRQYKDLEMPDDIMQQLDEFERKISVEGIRHIE